MRGLGDLIAWFLTPLEPLIRRFYGKKGCGCKKRQETLNKSFPNPFLPTPRIVKEGLTEKQIQAIKSKRLNRIGK